MKYLIETMGAGVALFDYDSDGWLDVFFVNGAKLNAPQLDSVQPDKSGPQFWNRLFRNNRDGTFSDVTEEAGLKGNGYGMGVATGDYNNDGHADLLVTYYGGVLLYRNNGDGTFTDVTIQAGLKTEGWTTSAGFFDYNNDGWLDLFICRYVEWNFELGARPCGVSVPGGRAYCSPQEFDPTSNYLFRNNGDGTFTDVSTTSGIASHKGKGLGIAFGDFDGNSFIDIYVANDKFPQFLFRNNGDGTFTEIADMAGVAYTEDGNVFSGMGTDGADINNDGKPDIISTALPYEYFAFFQNDGKGMFTYSSVTSGLARISRSYGGWGIHVFDADNDGLNEVFIATSHVMDNISVTEPTISYPERPLLLKYNENRFEDISPVSGAIFRELRVGRGAAFGDLNNDGRIDIVVSNGDGFAYFLQNQNATDNHWLALELRGTRSNRDGIGAKVALVSESGKRQYRMVTTTCSYLSASDRRVFFGLGSEKRVRQVHIHWPSGVRQVLENPPLDQFLSVIEEPSPDATPPDSREK